jgi:hypothetical protein
MHAKAAGVMTFFNKERTLFVVLFFMLICFLMNEKCDGANVRKTVVGKQRSGKQSEELCRLQTIAQMLFR